MENKIVRFRSRAAPPLRLTNCFSMYSGKVSPHYYG